MAGTISGKIKNAFNNTPIEGTIANIFQGIVDIQITDAGGAHTTNPPQAGGYYVQASKEGYEVSPRLGTQVLDGQTTTVDINLMSLREGKSFPQVV